MKYTIAIALLLGIFAIAHTEDTCHTSVSNACTSGNSILCNAKYGGIDNVEPKVQAYINLNLSKSYKYLLLATFFNSYQKNRPGFNKLYQGLSDRSFDDTIALIKQVTRRGGKVSFSTFSENPNTISQNNLKLEVDELHSLALALDNEKALADGAYDVHLAATHGKPHDPEMAHYIEEKFMGKQAESIRKVSGYVNDLSKIMTVNDPSLGIYLFDQYLEKQ